MSTALCRELTTVFSDGLRGPAPDAIMLIPAGPDVVGRDGRRWRLSDPRALVTDFDQRGVHVVIDWEHGSEAVRENPQRCPAAGWITGLDIRNGGEVWGRVEWTPDGRKDVESGSYRYISPSFDYRKSDSEIVRLTSVGLVHVPNLSAPALNAEGAEEPLSAEERHVIERMGFTEAEFRAFKKRQTAAHERAGNRGHGDSELSAEDRHVIASMGFTKAEFLAFKGRKAP